MKDPQSPDRDSYRIQTTTDASELVSATLKLRMTTSNRWKGGSSFATGMGGDDGINRSANTSASTVLEPPRHAPSTWHAAGSS